MCVCVRAHVFCVLVVEKSHACLALLVCVFEPFVCVLVFVTRVAYRLMIKVNHISLKSQERLALIDCARSCMLYALIVLQVTCYTHILAVCIVPEFNLYADTDG